MAKYRITLDFETEDNITLGMIVHGLEYNENDIRNDMFSEYPRIVGDCAVAYKIVEAREMSVKHNIEDVLDKNTDTSLFSVRTRNCLRYADICTVRELVRHKKSDLQQYRNFGKKTFEEIEGFFEDNDLHWEMNV